MIRVVHLARKPLSEGSVAKNVLKHGTGGLNIDESRITTPVTGPERRTSKPGAGAGGIYDSQGGLHGHWDGQERHNPQGRWPANLILQHKPSCERIGTKQESGYVINRWTDGAKPFGGGAGHPYESDDQGPEIVEVWACAPDCPVAELDEQSGSVGCVHNTNTRPAEQTRFGPSAGPHPTQGQLYADTGGASRFFKQTQTTGDGQ